MSDTPKICGITEFSDLVTDACITDERFNLVFGSFWGRDTVVQEILARITLNASDNLSLSSITVQGEGIHSPVYFNKDFLDKRMTKASGTLFGSMTNVWLYDQRVLQADYANYSSYILIRDGFADDEDHARIWNQIVDLAPFPILDHWKDRVLDVVVRHQMIQSMNTIFGNAVAKHIALKVDVLQNAISSMIRSGLLTTEIQ